MNNKQATTLFILILILQSCNVFKPKPSNEDKSHNIYLYQNGEEKLIGHEIEVEKKNFSIRFLNKRYNSNNKEFNSVKLASFLNIEEINKIKTGKSTSDFECFEPGSGMAPDVSGKYESLIFNNSGCHYLIYENSESKRLNLLEDFGEILKLEFEINALYYNGNEEKMSETKLNEFYLAILIDRNLDEIIDKNELYKVKVKIK